MNFMEAYNLTEQKLNNVTKTENGANALKSTTSALLDLFVKAPSMLKPEDNDIEELKSLIRSAIEEDPQLTLKCIFYLGDIREGAGVRRVFTESIRLLAEEYPKMLKYVLPQIPEFSRWDVLVKALLYTDFEDALTEIIKYQLESDLESTTPSLCAKWLPSSSSSSKNTRKLGRRLSHLLNLSGKKLTGVPETDKEIKKEDNIIFSKILTKLRKELDIVEHYIATVDYDKINYSKIPSVALNRYQTLFLKYDKARFMKWVTEAAEGKAKINSKRLYPFEIIKNILDNGLQSSYNREQDRVSMTKAVLADAQWKNMEDVIEGKEINWLVMADVSGSMTFHQMIPMSTSIATAIYCAEKTQGVFHNKFMTFSNEPEIVEIKGDNICEKVENAYGANWGNNTDLEKAFDLILEIAVNNKLKQEELPETLLIISDMEFDDATRQERRIKYDPFDAVYYYENYGILDTKTLFKEIQEKFNKHGYEMPTCVFWNVNADVKFPVDSEEKGCILLSGYSNNNFRALLGADLVQEEPTLSDVSEKVIVTPYESMIAILNSERYENIFF